VQPLTTPCDTRTADTSANGGDAPNDVEDRLAAAESGLKGAMDRLHASLASGADARAVETPVRSFRHTAPGRTSEGTQQKFASSMEVRRLSHEKVMGSRRHSTSSSQSLAETLSRYPPPPQPGRVELKAAAVARLTQDLTRLAEAASRAARDCPKCSPLACALESQALRELASLQSAMVRFRERDGQPEDFLSERRLAELSTSASEGLALLSAALDSPVTTAPPLQKMPTMEDSIEEARAELAMTRSVSASRLTSTASSCMLEGRRHQCQGETPTWTALGCEVGALADSSIWGPPMPSFTSFSSQGLGAPAAGPCIDSLVVTSGGPSSKSSPSKGSPARPVFAEVFGDIAASMQRSLSEIRLTKQAQAMARSPGSERSLSLTREHSSSALLANSSPGDQAAGVGPSVAKARSAVVTQEGGTRRMPACALWPQGLPHQELQFAHEFLKAAAAEVAERELVGAYAAAGGA